jgi:hypothetical protein
VDGDYPDREMDIRHALIRYSERILAQERPGWDLAEGALAMAGSLKLNNEEIQTQQRQVRLREARYLLNKEDDFTASASIFADLLADAERPGIQEELKAEMARIVCEYITQRADRNQWHHLDQVFEQVKSMWTAEKGLQSWLEAISKTLKAAVRAQEEGQRQLEAAKRSLRRYRGFFYATMVIFISMALLYLAVLLL